MPVLIHPESGLAAVSCSRDVTQWRFPTTSKSAHLTSRGNAIR